MSIKVQYSTEQSLSVECVLMLTECIYKRFCQINLGINLMLYSFEVSFSYLCGLKCKVIKVRGKLYQIISIDTEFMT